MLFYPDIRILHFEILKCKNFFCLKLPNSSRKFLYFKKLAFKNVKFKVSEYSNTTYDNTKYLPFIWSITIIISIHVIISVQSYKKTGMQKAFKAKLIIMRSISCAMAIEFLLWNVTNKKERGLDIGFLSCLSSSTCNHHYQHFTSYCRFQLVMA